ncbi:hypothetical protein [Sporomusa sp. KB1]|jgi:hypothetical protein|uniref:hypothetical protein n=1 Tax=Sporomusa sp. KB1 TaxID=943346 RepID=UPI00119E5B51|nr:hypothetical protein [Sporomusa sp. KB1]TWH51600.1 hypothetical protein Salpa_0042 [Sporomusa sp. KB1]TWH52179.1 hypothetical protein Salpa_0701 [Sporomusa sp. KB1]
MQSHNVPDCCTVLCLEELEKKARRLANSTKTTVAAGNSIVIFTMLILEEILEQLALDPITNLASIIVVANSIASLNNSVKIDP